MLRDGPSNTPIETYGYDATGNRTSLLHSGVTTSFTYPSTSHRLSSAGGVARTYDGVGNTLTIGGTAKQFNYGEDDRIHSLQVGGTVVRGYAYNALGERVLSTVPAVAENPDGSSGTPAIHTYSVYDESGRWLGDYGTNGAVIQQAIWLDDLPVGLLAGAGAQQKLHYIEPDHLGTPRAVIDRTRNLAIWTWALQGEAFGNSPPNQDPDLDGTNFVFDMRFPGQRYDAATGLNYNYFRDYDAGSGRYAQSDPIGQKGGLATYAYAGASPLGWIDFYGLRPGECYESADIAAAHALGEINPKSIRIDREFAGWIYRTSNGWYSYTSPIMGIQHASNPGKRVPGAISDYHTHGAYNDGNLGDEPSGGDWNTTPYGQTNYLGTPSGQFKKYKYNGQVREIDRSLQDECAKDCRVNRNESILYRLMKWWYEP